MSLSILMNGDTKELQITKKAKIRQGESLADKLYIIVPFYIGEVDVRDFTATLLYLDPAHVSHMEILVREEDIYKEAYYRYQLSLDSEFTRMAGDCNLQVSLSHQDTETDESYIIHSGQITIPVLSFTDFYAFTPPSSLNSIDQRLLEIDNQIQALAAAGEAYDKARATDLKLTDDLLQLQNQDGEVMGKGVEILVTPDDPDHNPSDGEIDLDIVDDSSSVTTGD